MHNAPARTTVAARILADRMPWSTIHGEGILKAAATVLTGTIEEIAAMFKTEIHVHTQCDNYIKADELARVLRSLR